VEVPVESPVYLRRQSSPFVDGARVGARRTSGSFRHVGHKTRPTMAVRSREPTNYIMLDINLDDSNRTTQHNSDPGE
jgi:hypothetical protein